MVNLVVQLQISTIVGGVIALLTTVLRLFFRRNRLWWDDACAAFSMLFFLLYVASVFIDIYGPITGNESRSTRIAGYYLMSSSFHGIVWPARLSMLFSMIRIDPNPRRRTIILLVAGIFALVGILLAAQVFWLCATNPTWGKLFVPQCPLGTQFVVCQLVSDIAADSILMVIPIKLFHNILEAGLRRRLMFIFSASFMTTVVSLVHKGYIIVHGDLKDLIAAGVEACVSLVVCNLPVFLIATLRLREEISNRDDGLGTSRISIEAIETIISLNNC